MLEGQYEAYEVNKVTDVSVRWVPRVFHRKHIATLWDEDEAKKLNVMFNGNLHDVSGSINQIGVIVVGSDAYYDTQKPPVPVELIRDTATSATALMIDLAQLA